MFAQKLRLTLTEDDVVRPVPKAWLDQFFMRSFTGYSAFDETLPVEDGLLETGRRVDVAEVQAQFEKWLRGRKMIPPAAALAIETLAPGSAA